MGRDPEHADRLAAYCSGARCCDGSGASTPLQSKQINGLLCRLSPLKAVSARVEVIPAYWERSFDRFPVLISTGKRFVVNNLAPAVIHHSLRAGPFPLVNPFTDQKSIGITKPMYCGFGPIGFNSGVRAR